MATRTVVIVGDGAIGSQVRTNARNWGATLRVIDFDKVEMKNTQAQMHPVQSRGKNKAQSAQSVMRGMWGWKIEAIPHKLTPDNSRQLLGDADLIIDCTDNVDARTTIMAASREFNIPCLHGCLSPAGNFARVVWTEHFKPDQEDAGVPTCEDGEHLPFFALAGAHIAQEAQRFLKDGTKRSLMILPTSVKRLA